MGVYQDMVSLGRRMGFDEDRARRFADGRDGPDAEKMWAAVEAQDTVRAAAQMAEKSIAADPSAPVDPIVDAVTEAAQSTLHMGVAEARKFAVELWEREERRGGKDHAGKWLKAFDGAIRTVTPAGKR